MKMRAILPMAVLSVGLATMTLAKPQTGVQPAQPVSARLKLRPELARLRAEIELLEIEHEAKRSHLLESLKEVGKIASNSGQSALVDVAILEQLKALAMSGAEDSLAKLQKLQTPEGETSMRKEIEKGVKDEVKGTLADIDRLKRDFVKRTTELNMRRLDLAEVEKRYSAAK